MPWEGGAAVSVWFAGAPLVSDAQKLHREYEFVVCAVGAQHTLRARYSVLKRALAPYAPGAHSWPSDPFSGLKDYVLEEQNVRRRGEAVRHFLANVLNQADEGAVITDRHLHAALGIASGAPILAALAQVAARRKRAADSARAAEAERLFAIEQPLEPSTFFTTRKHITDAAREVEVEVARLEAIDQLVEPATFFERLAAIGRSVELTAFCTRRKHVADAAREVEVARLAAVDRPVEPTTFLTRRKHVDAPAREVEVARLASVAWPLEPTTFFTSSEHVADAARGVEVERLASVDRLVEPTTFFIGDPVHSNIDANADIEGVYSCSWTEFKQLDSGPGLEL